MSRVLVTGGAGFIGSHTVRRLLDTGHEVFAYDFFHQYIHPIQPTFLENMQYRFETLLNGAQVLRGSTTNKDGLRRHLTDVKPEYIIHLAALPLANVALRQTEEAFEGIVQGTVNMLEILRDMEGIKRFVYISSSMIYGDFKQIPMPEDGHKDPKEIYGGMKLCGELLVRVFSKRYDIPYSIVRPSAVYGPTDNNRRVLQIFVENAVCGKPINAVDPEATFLDFSYVKDVAEGLRCVTFAPAAENEDFNITCGQGRSLGEAVEVLRKHFPNLDVRVKANEETFRPSRGALDVTKAERLAGYKSTYTLEQGITEYVEYMRVQNRSLFPAGSSA